MQKKIKKYNLIIIGLIFFIPIIIHIAYSLYVNKIISSKWLAGDILLYCATILSAFVAWFSSHSTLEKTQRNNAKPYIAIEKLLYSKKMIYKVSLKKTKN